MNRSDLLPKLPLLRRAEAYLRENTRLCGAICALLGGFALSGVRLPGSATPIAACLCVAVSAKAYALAAAPGAMIGYLLTAGEQAPEYIALTGLMFCAKQLFCATAPGRKRAFFPLLAGVSAALLGAVARMDEPFSFASAAFWAAQSLLAGCSVEALRAALRGNRRARLFAVCALAASASGFGLPAQVSVFCAALPAALGASAVSSATAGLVLDLCCGFGGRATAALLPAALLFGAESRQSARPLRLAAQLLLPVCIFAALGKADVAQLPAYVAGTLAGEGLRGFLPREVLFGGTRRPLHEAAELLELLARQLPAPEAADLHEADAVLDGAAERVCRCCPQFAHCWRENAEQTCRVLLAAAEPALVRGVARGEDFSEEFRADCLHFDGFLTAVDQELETLLRRRRYRAQTEEYRRLIAQEYRDTAQFLRGAAGRAEERDARAPFRVELAVDTAQKAGASGDCVSCFAGTNGRYFVLLCDAMGSGAEAARLSAESARFLRKLLRAGFAPEAALRLLNGVYLLREDGCFATVDLLCIDRNDAGALLCKWGAAPSYLRAADGLRQIGAQSLPPGLGAQCAPQTSQFSLAEGELLVMASDGAQRARLVRTLEEESQLPLRPLAQKLVRASAAQDDTSIIALRLLREE